MLCIPVPNSPQSSNGRVPIRKKNLVFERPTPSSSGSGGEDNLSKPSSIHKRAVSASLMEKMHAVSGGIKMPQDDEVPFFVVKVAMLVDASFEFIVVLSCLWY